MEFLHLELSPKTDWPDHLSRVPTSRMVRTDVGGSFIARFLSGCGLSRLVSQDFTSSIIFPWNLIYCLLFSAIICVQVCSNRLISCLVLNCNFFTSMIWQCECSWVVAPACRVSSSVLWRRRLGGCTREIHEFVPLTRFFYTIKYVT
jgi:hypothetical protein